jgi:hypothetical protein
MLTRRRVIFAAFLVAVAAMEYAIFFWRASHFFQGDTIYWFYYRLSSFGDFLLSFTGIDPGGWYRPLTNRTIQSLFYPFFGLNPAPYRWIQYALFVVDTLAVYGLAMMMTRKTTAAAIATVFFSIHTINAYVTYDLSFTPELLYTLFYILSAIAFLKYLEQGRRLLLMASVFGFALSLCSKESALTLPVALAVVALFLGFKPKRVASSLVPHAVLLAGYLWMALGRLGVAAEALASFQNHPTVLEAGGYYFFIGPHILSNAISAWAWALNLPVGMLGVWRVITRSRNLVLWGFAAVQMALIVYGFVRGERKSLAAAVAWFWITAAPALPLLGHFLPYYMFLPITGVAVIVGLTWNKFYEDVSERVPAAGGLMLASTFGVLILVCSRTARSEASNNGLLGGSSRMAEQSLRDLRRLYPSPEHGTTFFINDQSQPDLVYHQARGMLFKLAYADDSLEFKYSTLKELPPAEPAEKVVRLRFQNGHLDREP